jgi:amino acid adenylation domain-containing protein
MADTPVSMEEALRSLSGEKRRLLERLVRSAGAPAASKVPARSRENGSLPLSWAQQRLWFIDQLEGGAAGYFIPLAFRLNGQLNRDALLSALNDLVRRHDSLRTLFSAQEGVPHQEVLPEQAFTLSLVDLRHVTEDAREASVREHATEEARGKFDLRHGPLIRGRLLHLQNDEHVLLITLHHIVGDGWSVGILCRELERLYDAHVRNVTPLLPALAVQYVDYAQWQRQWLKGSLLDKQLRYWRAALRETPNALELPTCQRRPPTQSYRGDNVAINFGVELTSRLRSMAQRLDMTLFMVLYAGLAILLSRLSGQDDVVIGTPVANRQRREFEGLIGFFANTLALRVRVVPELTTFEFLAQVKEVTLGGYDHQDIPFEQVVADVHPERHSSRNPLFQVMLGLQNTPLGKLKLAGLECTSEATSEEPAIFDLFFSLAETAQEVVGYVNYAVDLFDRHTVARWVDNYERVLWALTDGADQSIGALSILTETERRQLVIDFNPEPSRDVGDRMVHQFFEEQVAATPEAVALVCDGESLTYAQLNEKSNELAWQLLEDGVGPDEIVGICVERSVEMVVGLLAILKAGGAYLPLDPNYPAERLAHMLDDASPRSVLTQERLRPILPATSAKLISIDPSPVCERATSKGNPTVETTGSTSRNLVYLIYTSGSTGRPKGTAMTHRSMVNLLDWHRSQFRSTRHRVTQFAALSFDVAFQEIFSTLSSGATLVLVDEVTRRDPQALAEFLTRQCITRLFIPPLMLQMLADYSTTSNKSPLSLREVIAAGEQLRLTPAVIGFFKGIPDCVVHNHYGPTETHVVTALTLEGNPEQWPALPGIGKPISNTQIYILDSGLQPAPLGVSGEIYIGGANVARGYLNRPGLTAQRFIADPFGTNPDARLYKTGDLGRWLADGTIEYLGRNDDQVKIRGYRIELGEIEAVLHKHIHVQEAVVIAREDVPGAQRLIAYVTRAGAIAPSIRELQTAVRAELPEFMVPSAFVVLDNLPLSPNGKLDRRALPAPSLEAHVSREFEPPVTATERELATIWQAALGVERVGRTDNFFELGGHSLMAMKLVSSIAQRLHVQLPVVVVFRFPTVCKMAERIESLRTQAKTGTVQFTKPGNRQPAAALETGTDLIPLTYTQLQHWNLYRLDKQPTYRFVASVTKLLGPLDRDVFQRSSLRVVDRHEALRLHIVVHNGAPMQAVGDRANASIEQVDARSIPEEGWDREIARIIEAVILEPIEVTRGPLFAVRLVRLNDRHHVLVLAAEHIISDASSLRLFLRDLATDYAYRSSGRESKLAGIAVQFREYALRQHNNEDEWLQLHADHWRRTVTGHGRMRFPPDLKPSTVPASGWASAPVHIGREVKAELEQWCRSNGTSLIMVVFTVYSALVARWCECYDGIIQFMGNSRVAPYAEDTFGFFAAPLHVNIELRPSDTFSDLLKRTTESYCDAYEHADFSYLEAQLPRPEFTRNTVFNWIPQLAQSASSGEALSPLTYSQMHFELPFLKLLERDGEPLLVLYDTTEGATGGMYYARNQFSAQTMERFIRNFLMLVEVSTREPLRPLREIPFVT